MKKIMFYKKKSGHTLIELVSALTVFAIVIAMLISGINLLAKTASEETKNGSEYEEMISFSQRVLMDAKSARAVTFSGEEVVFYHKGDVTTVYRIEAVNKIYRNDIPVITQCKKCSFEPSETDLTHFTLNIKTHDNITYSYPMQLGVCE